MGGTCSREHMKEGLRGNRPPYRFRPLPDSQPAVDVDVCPVTLKDRQSSGGFSSRSWREHTHCDQIEIRYKQTDFSSKNIASLFRFPTTLPAKVQYGGTVCRTGLFTWRKWSSHSHFTLMPRVTKKMMSHKCLKLVFQKSLDTATGAQQSRRSSMPTRCSAS